MMHRTTIVCVVLATVDLDPESGVLVGVTGENDKATPLTFLENDLGQDSTAALLHLDLAFKSARQ